MWRHFAQVRPNCRGTGIEIWLPVYQRCNDEAKRLVPAEDQRVIQKKLGLTSRNFTNECCPWHIGPIWW